MLDGYGNRVEPGKKSFHVFINGKHYSLTLDEYLNWANGKLVLVLRAHCAPRLSKLEQSVNA